MRPPLAPFSVDAVANANWGRHVDPDPAMRLGLKERSNILSPSCILYDIALLDDLAASRGAEFDAQILSVDKSRNSHGF